MISPEFKSELLGQQKKLRRIWFAFGDSVLIFIAIPHLLPSLFDGEYQYAEIVRAGLWVLAVGDGALLAWWKKKYLSKESIFREAMSKDDGVASLPLILAQEIVEDLEPRSNHSAKSTVTCVETA